jgi:hypothetical protein
MDNGRLRRVAIVASLSLVTAALGALGVDASAIAATDGHARPSPHLRHARPLTHNPVLNGRNDRETAAEPNVTALCAGQLGAPNPFGNPVPNVDVIVGDTVAPTRSWKGCAAAQDETTVAVNPSNPRNVVAGSNDYRVFNTRVNGNDASGWAYTSMDAGKTWMNVQLPHLTFQTGATGALSDMDSAGDPAIAFGPHNSVYYANIVFSRLNLGGGIVVSASHDGGLTWGEPSIVQLDGVDASGNGTSTDVFNDKEWIGVDQRSGAVYVSWTRFDATASPIVVSKSVNGGATWSARRPVSPTVASFAPGGITPYDQGSFPVVGSDGSLFIAYAGAVCQTLACGQAGDHDAVVVAKSTNGGSSFVNREVAINYDFPVNPDVEDQTLTGENFRINSFPSLAIDPTSDRLYVSWADDRNGTYDSAGHSVRTNGDVFVSTSSNGVQWQRPITLGSSQDEVFPAVAAYGGRVAVSYYTRKYDPNGIGLDVGISTGNGMGRLKNSRVARVTTQTSNPQVQFVGIGAVSGKVLQGMFIGDYTGLAMGSDLIAHPTWTDFRGNPTLAGSTPNQEVYSQAVHLH